MLKNKEVKEMSLSHLMNTIPTYCLGFSILRMSQLWQVMKEEY